MSGDITSAILPNISVLVASDPALLEDSAVVQNRIAMRIGSDGWIVLGSLPDNELDRLTELERAGGLTNEALALAVPAARLGKL
jgi:hypothetical protein